MAGATDAWLDRVRTGQVCFDATVPRHFVSAGATQALIQTFAGRANWPQAIEVELRRSGVAGIGDILDGKFASITDLLPGEEQLVEDLRLTSLTRAEIRSKPTKNRGEAECVVACRRTGHPVFMHDMTGRDWARADGIGLFSAIDALCVSVRLGVCKPAQAWRIYLRMCGEPDPMFPWVNFPPTDRGQARFMSQAEPLYSLYVAEEGAKSA